MGEQEAHDRSLHAKYKIKECTDLIKYDMLQNLYREVNVLFYFIAVFCFFLYEESIFLLERFWANFYFVLTFLRRYSVKRTLEMLGCRLA